MRRALFWLSFAYRPLKIDELNEAVVIDGSTSVLGDDMRLVSPQILLQISQGLITQDKSGNVSLAHSSVRDFLASDWIRSSRVRGFGLDPSKADTIIMRQCLAYLCLDNFRSGYVSSTRLALKRIQDHPFLKYAAQLWALHAETCVFGTRDWHLLSRFFNSRRLPRRGNFGVWVQALIPNVEISNIDVTEPLYYAASFGLVPVVRAILASDPDIDVDAPGGRTGATALFIACFRRSYEVVDMLVLAGADVDFVDKDSHCSVRKLAARDGHVFPYRKRKGIDSLSYVNN